MPEFYVIIAQKNFSQNFRGHVPSCPRLLRLCPQKSYLDARRVGQLDTFRNLVQSPFDIHQFNQLIQPTRVRNSNWKPDRGTTQITELFYGSWWNQLRVVHAMPVWTSCATRWVIENAIHWFKIYRCRLTAKLIVAQLSKWRRWDQACWDKLSYIAPYLLWPHRRENHPAGPRT